MNAKIENIPTNIITGFLGVGKTTAILHLLEQKPVNERWAVLVNEFGEIGIDGSLFENTQKNADEHQAVFFKEVPGGCMCCSAGLPMQVALTLLIAEAKPDRLLIEPTGLGHPEEVLQVLTSDSYADVLDIQKTITMIDARKVADSRYANHSTFRQQLEIADIIIANKSDQYDDQDIENLTEYLQTLGMSDSKPLHYVSMGALQLSWLQGATNSDSKPDGHVHHSHADKESFIKAGLVKDADMPECGFITISNHGEGFFSQGWVFRSDICFDYQQLFLLFSCVNLERLKGVFNTDKGYLAFNKADGVLSEFTLEKVPQSRIELINRSDYEFNQFQSELLECIKPGS